MPTRILRDGINDSLRINALSEGAELFYRKLMSLVDDFGRYEAEPQLLLAKLYALRKDRKEKDVERFLAECVSGEEPLLKLYSVGRKKYLQINQFGQRERTSKYPSSEEGIPGLPQPAALRRRRPQNAASRARPTTTPTPTAKEGSAEGNPAAPPSLEETLDRTSARLHGAHPPPRRDIGRGEIRNKLQQILRLKNLKGDAAIVYLEQVAERHVRMCQSGQWMEDGGKYAKGLENWLAPMKGRYEQEPPALLMPPAAARDGPHRFDRRAAANREFEERMREEMQGRNA